MDASNKEAIRLLANDAARDFEAGRYEAALDKFQRAFETARVPRLVVWLAKTQVKLGHLVVAHELYRQALGLEKNELWVGTTQEQAQQEAQQDLAALQQRIPRLTIRVEGANSKDVALKIDDVEVPSTLIGVERFANPGQRQIVARVGVAEVRQQATLVEGEHKEILLKFAQTATTVAPVAAPLPNQPNPTTISVAPSGTGMRDSGSSNAKTQRTWGWAGVGIGAAGVAFGATTGIMVAIKHGKLSDICPNGDCPPEHWTERDNYEMLRKLSTIGFIVGGVGAAAGVTLLLTSPKQESKPNLSLWLAPASAGLRGMF
jgi:hypothetical protein